jgi:hypothetical protein
MPVSFPRRLEKPQVDIAFARTILARPAVAAFFAARNPFRARKKKPRSCFQERGLDV